MGILGLIIIGAAAGFIATRMMDLELSIPVTVAIGILGSLIGGAILRFLLSMLGVTASFVGAIFGAVLLIWLYKTYVEKR